MAACKDDLAVWLDKGYKDGWTDGADPMFDWQIGWTEGLLDTMVVEKMITIIIIIK